MAQQNFETRRRWRFLAEAEPAADQARAVDRPTAEQGRGTCSAQSDPLYTRAEGGRSARVAPDTAKRLRNGQARGISFGLDFVATLPSHLLVGLEGGVVIYSSGPLRIGYSIFVTNQRVPNHSLGAFRCSLAANYAASTADSVGLRPVQSLCPTNSSRHLIFPARVSAEWLTVDDVVFFIPTSHVRRQRRRRIRCTLLRLCCGSSTSYMCDHLGLMYNMCQVYTKIPPRSPPWPMHGVYQYRFTHHDGVFALVDKADREAGLLARHVDDAPAEVHPGMRVF